MTITSKSDIYDTLGSLDGECGGCGAPARRMGWLGEHHRYWLMCVASGLTADADAQYGACDLPTEAKARQRLSVADERVPESEET